MNQPKKRLRFDMCLNKLRSMNDDGVNLGSGSIEIIEMAVGSTCLTARCSGAAAVDLSSFIGRRRPTERER